ncbi:MAG: NAD(P)H-dependent oxidoreductase subunit E, partial [Bacilli bacterium]|nr:NAD(P)H-dependent oxidoreductase subunit E [Bacilli bacterium]
MFRLQVVICEGHECKNYKANEIRKEFEEKIKLYNIDKQVSVFTTNCFGFCEKAPVAIIYPECTLYASLKAEDVDEICTEHLIKGKVVTRLAYTDITPEDEQKIIEYQEKNFHAKQERRVLRNCGIINPMNINEYIGRDGYFALNKALVQMAPDEVIEEISKSGLSGRGGGGFPTGLKLKLTSKNKSDQKYIICNADEGDPGAFMDRAVLEGDPHTVIEAMIIAGYAIGASQGYIYARAEYPLAVERINQAIQAAYQYNLLGDNIFGSGFSFNLETRLGAGAFVCGEETALIASIEGERGMPRNKPPYPAESGLWNRPTVINNVETFANIPQIILKGADWFKSIGTEKAKGTKVFALGGKINNTGLVEISMGTTLREVIDNIGGGIPNNKKFKAVQT